MPAPRDVAPAVAAGHDIGQIDQRQLMHELIRGRGQVDDARRVRLDACAVIFRKDHRMRAGVVGSIRTRPRRTWVSVLPLAATLTPNSVPRSTTEALGVLTVKPPNAP